MPKKKISYVGPAHRREINSKDWKRVLEDDSAVTDTVWSADNGYTAEVSAAQAKFLETDPDFKVV